MIQKREVEDIIKLLNRGFKEELISFELDIPIEYVTECKKQLEKRMEQSAKKSVSKKAKTSADKENTSHARMQKMREKYNKLAKVSDNKNSKAKPQTDEEREVVNEVISKLEQEIGEMDNKTESKKRKVVNEMLPTFDRIKDINLTVEQSEKIDTLLSSRVLVDIGNIANGDKTDNAMYKVKSGMRQKYIDAIIAKINELDDIQELKNFGRLLETRNRSKMFLTGSVSMVNSKIVKLQQLKLDRDVPPDIAIQIAKSIATNNFDYESANRDLEDEAKRQVDSKPKTKFSITEQQAKQQILIKIRKLLTDTPEEYPLVNPEEAISDLYKLDTSKPELAIRTVTKNLTGRQDFKKARQVSYSAVKGIIGDEQNSLAYMKLLRSEIESAEMSHLLLHYLTATDIPDAEEREFLETFDSKVRAKKISMTTILPRKNGQKPIALKDIYTQNVQER